MRLRSHGSTAKAVADVNAQARRFVSQWPGSMTQLSDLIGPQHPRARLTNMTVVMGWSVEPTSRCWKHHCRIGHEHGVPQPDMVTLMEVALAQAGAVPLPAIGFETGLMYRVRVTGRGAAANLTEHPMGVSLSVTFASSGIGAMQALRAMYAPVYTRQAELWMSCDTSWVGSPDVQHLLVSLTAMFGSPTLLWDVSTRGHAPVLGRGSAGARRAPDLFAGPERA